MINIHIMYNRRTLENPWRWRRGRLLFQSTMGATQMMRKTMRLSWRQQRWQAPRFRRLMMRRKEGVVLEEECPATWGGSGSASGAAAVEELRQPSTSPSCTYASVFHICSFTHTWRLDAYFGTLTFSYHTHTHQLLSRCLSWKLQWCTSGILNKLGSRYLCCWTMVSCLLILSDWRKMEARGRKSMARAFSWLPSSLRSPTAGALLCRCPIVRYCAVFSAALTRAPQGVRGRTVAM